MPGWVQVGLQQKYHTEEQNIVRVPISRKITKHTALYP